MKRYTSVDDYVAAADHWREELLKLRQVLLATELEETVKWGGPCYTYAGKNVVGLGAFKSYVGLWYFQGALLSDPQGVLINAQAGKTKAMRQWRFTSSRDIKVRTIKAYVREAVELAKDGVEIKPQRRREIEVPQELQRALAENKPAGKAFQQLTPGRQREYSDYISEAKREETRVKRVDKILPMIANGQGLNDRYRK